MAQAPRKTNEKGPRVEVRGTEQGPQLFVGGVLKRHGVFDDGMYFLHDYAYDWADDLEELGKRFVAYRQRVEAVRAERTEPGAG